MTVGCQTATPQYLSQTCDFDKKRIVITVIKDTKKVLKRYKKDAKSNDDGIGSICSFSKLCCIKVKLEYM